MLRTGFEIKVTIINDTQNKPDGLLAEAELVFRDGMLDGVNLEGFGIWENKDQTGFNVTFPARPYTKGHKTQYYDLFRPTNKHARSTVTEFIVAEFRREFQRAEAAEKAEKAEAPPAA
jgi:DNA-binding cell septation regulator SpoVG